MLSRSSLTVHNARIQLLANTVNVLALAIAGTTILGPIFAPDNALVGWVAMSGPKVDAMGPLVKVHWWEIVHWGGAVVALGMHLVAQLSLRFLWEKKSDGG